MRQIIYASEAREQSATALAPAILRQSRVQNGMDGITGLLCACDNRFLQVLEGPKESVALAWARIQADPRHHRIEILEDQAIAERGFADWTMAYRDVGQPEDILDERLRRLFTRVPAAIADRFRAFTGV